MTDDKKDNNVVCDLMLGRTFIAASRHSCVDTRGTGALVSLDSTCRRCQFIADSTGESQLMMPDTDTRVTVETIMNKIQLLSSLVQSRVHLNDEAKNYLYGHLMTSIDLYDIDRDCMEDIGDDEVSSMLRTMILLLP